MKKSNFFLLVLCSASAAAPQTFAAPTKARTLTAEQKRFIAATKQAFSKSPKAAAKGKIPPKAKALTTEQKKSVSSAIKELRKLEAAVEVGLTNEKYTDRLIDAKAEIQDSLSAVPNTPVKSLVLECLKNYEDAQDIWSDYIKNEFVNGYVDITKDTLSKYKIVLPQAVPDYASFRERPSLKIEYFDGPISKIWTQASLNINKAATLNK